MDSNQWIEVGKTFGLPAVLLFGLSFALYKGMKALFPFLVRHFESSQQLLKEQLDHVEASRRAEQQEFMAALDKRDLMMDKRDRMAEEVGKQQAQAMQALAAEFRALADKLPQRGSAR